MLSLVQSGRDLFSVKNERSKGWNDLVANDNMDIIREGTIGYSYR